MCGIEPVENISLKPDRSQVDSVMIKFLFDMQKDDWDVVLDPHTLDLCVASD